MKRVMLAMIACGSVALLARMGAADPARRLPGRQSNRLLGKVILPVRDVRDDEKGSRGRS